MFILALVCSKGGAGKTTMAVHLAVEGHRRGFKTLLIDIDTQASAAKIMDRRGEDPPDVTTEAAGRLEKALDAARNQGYDLVVVDTAPQADRAASQAAKVANMVVAPVQPSIVDLDAVDPTVDIWQTGERAGIVRAQPGADAGPGGQRHRGSDPQAWDDRVRRALG